MLGGASALLLALGGCSASPDQPGAEGKTLSIATTNAVTSLNSSTSQGNLDTNGMVEYLTQQLGSFYTLNPNFEVVPNEEVGTIEQLSSDPLTVKYTLTPGQTWSDGAPVTASDMLLNWVIGSGWFDDATLDPVSNELTSGSQYFSLAGSTAGLDTTSFPEISEDNLSLTLTYDAPFVDWNLVNLINGKPIHVLAKQVGMTAAELVAHFESLPAGDPAQPAPQPDGILSQIAQFWNTAYDGNTLPANPDLLVTSGPFVVSDAVPEQSITLSKNERYHGQYEPGYDHLVLRFIGDSNAQVTALKNGEVNAIYTQPSADTVSALEAMGAEQFPGDQLAYDHLDLNHNSEVFADPAVREAFLKTIPRKQLVDSLILPANPHAEVLNSQIFVPSNLEYAEAVKTNGYSAFGAPDIDGAKTLLAGRTPTVKILYNTENPNRVDSFQAIKASAEQAGFVVTDGGSPDWSKLLPSGDYDVSIFGWVSSGVGSAALPQIFRSGGGGNYSGYSNAQVDALVDESQSTLDEQRLTAIKIEIDALTREDFYGLPLFQTPGLFAGNGSISGVNFFGGQTGLVWNAQEWKLK